MLAFPADGKYLREIRKNRAVMELIRRYDQGGQLRKISAEALAVARAEIREKAHQSNDQHILSLALASEASILCSNDSDLRADFKNKDILPPMGRQSRKLYPVDGSRRTRREFLNRQRCPNR